MSFDLSDYVDVAERIRIFRDKHPGGALQSEVSFANDGVLCKAWAYRGPDDATPGIGHSFLAIPGTTPYTRGSEVENAETSAWGRAIVAALAADTKKVASADEVRSKHEGSTAPVGTGGGGGAAASTGFPPESVAAPTSPFEAPASARGGDLCWKYGEHQGLSIAATPLDFVIRYAEEKPDTFMGKKCKEFLAENDFAAAGVPDSDIPFDRTIDGLGG